MNFIITFFRFHGIVALLMVFQLAYAAESLPVPGPHKPRILILWGSGGHKTAAEAIEEHLRNHDPHVEIISKNFADLYPWHKKYFFNTGYGQLQRNFPAMIVKDFKNSMVDARSRGKVSDEAAGFTDPALIEKYVEGINPDVVISTHVSVTKDLARLREQGHLSKYPVAWLHTDLVAETNFAQVSAEIDRTFSPHALITENWIERGIPSERVVTTGITVKPVSTVKFTADQVSEFQKELKLDKSKRTMVIMGGSFGGVPYDQIVEDIVRHQGNQPLQIVAICANNQKQKKILDQVREGKAKLPGGTVLPASVDLRTTALVPPQQLVKYLSSSDYIITKPGGLSTFEMMYREKPVIFFDAVGGQESENAKFIAKLKAGAVVKDASEIGALLTQLEADPKSREEMIQAQREFQKGMAPEKIVEWAFSSPQVMQPMVLPHPVLRIGDTVTSPARCADLMKSLADWVPQVGRSVGIRR